MLLCVAVRFLYASQLATTLLPQCCRWHTLAHITNTQAPAGDRFGVLAASGIKRYYHSTAMLLPSGDLLVMGSEQSEYSRINKSCPANHVQQAARESCFTTITTTL